MNSPESSRRFTRSPPPQQPDRFRPLNSTFNEVPVLFVDSHASVDDLHEFACTRIHIATELLESLTCLTVHDTYDRDIARFVNGAFILLRDGCDLLDVISDRRIRLAEKSD